MRESEKEFRKALMCLYLEAPESVCQHIEATFEAYREDMMKQLNQNYYTEEEHTKVKKKVACEVTQRKY